MIFTCQAFEDLSAKAIYEWGRLRQAVFVLEQNAPYLDFDEADLQAYHLMGRAAEAQPIVLYARLLPPGLAYPDAASIGRVCIAADYRGQGWGRPLFAQAMQEARQRFGEVDLRISAQTYLRGFYASFGFKAYGPCYLEDLLPHQGMRFEAEQWASFTSP